MSASSRLNSLKEEEKLLVALLDKVNEHYNQLQTEELAIISQLKTSSEGFASALTLEAPQERQESIITDNSVIAEPIQLDLEVGEVLHNLAKGGSGDCEEEEEEEEEDQ